MSQGIRPLVVGLTGGMGAGKSTVVSHLRTLRDFDGNIFDCDAMVHRLYAIPAMRAWLEEKFGEMPDDARAHCSKMAIGNPHILAELEKMFTAALKLELREWIHLSTEGNVRYTIVDAPLLFEAHLDAACDAVIVIDCPIEIRRERIMQRPGMTKEKMEFLLERQLSDRDRLVFADYVIKTDCDVVQTYKQTEAVLAAIRSRAYA